MTCDLSEAAGCVWGGGGGLAGSALDALPAHVGVIDQNGVILEVNASWARYARANGGHDGEFFRGWNYLRVCESASGECSGEATAAAAGIREVLAGRRDTFTLEYPCHTPDRRQWYFLRAASFLHQEERFAVVSHEDVTQRKLAELAVQAEAETDELTGLANRRAIHEQIERAMRHRADDPAQRLAVYFLDFDRFKLVNDSIGHDAGDELLKQIADRLSSACSGPGFKQLFHDSTASVARFGGDEFVVLVENLPGDPEIDQVATYLSRALQSSYLIDGREVTSTASIGVAIPDEDATTPDELIRNADTAMYAAKRRGNACHVRYTPQMHQASVTRLTIETDLRKSIERTELFLAYQPILSLATGDVVAFEALLRWRHPELGLVSPGEFIPVAEESGSINEIGQWVLDTACRQLHAWHEETGRQDLRMNVNLSRKQLLLTGLPEQIARVLREHKVPPQSLVCEVTENAIQADPDAICQTLGRLRELGCQIATDDFGTGQSSLASLHQLPLDILKIDRSFIANLSNRRDFAAIINAINVLAHNLGMRVTAEGVEIQDQVSALLALECDTAQGFLFSRPVEAEQAAALLMEGITFEGLDRRDPSAPPAAA